MLIPPWSDEDRANFAAMQRVVTATMAEAQMVDLCQRLKHTPGRDADNQETEPTYTAGAVYPCRFRWGTGNTDRTREVEGTVVTSPQMDVPLSATFTSDDHVLLTWRYDQQLIPPLRFAIDGKPMIEAGYKRLELKQVTTGTEDD